MNICTNGSFSVFKTFWQFFMVGLPTMVVPGTREKVIFPKDDRAGCQTWTLPNTLPTKDA